VTRKLRGPSTEAGGQVGELLADELDGEMLFEAGVDGLADALIDFAADDEDDAGEAGGGGEVGI
jgi:hypothetical protein